MTDKRLEEFGADSVQVIATSVDNSGTIIASRGKGNYYARIGACEKFLKHENDYEFISELRGALNDSRDEGGDFQINKETTPG